MSVTLVFEENVCVHNLFSPTELLNDDTKNVDDLI